MPGKILGLDLSEETITAVQVKSGLKGYEVTACARVIFNGTEALDEAMEELFSQLDFKSDLCLASIPGERTSFRNLHMPFSEPKKIRQTLPFEIETMIPFSIEELILDFNINVHLEQSEILAVGVRKAFIAEYLACLLNHGIDPDVLEIRCVPIITWLMQLKETPNSGILLDIGEEKSTVILYLERQIALIRALSMDSIHRSETNSAESQPEDEPSMDREKAPVSPETVEARFRSLCTKVQNTLHALGSQSNQVFEPEKVFFTGVSSVTPEAADLLNRYLNLPVEQIDLARDKRIHMDANIAKIWDPALMDGALALALRETKKGPGFNLRKNDFEIKKHHSRLKAEIKKAAVFAFILLVFLGGYVGVDYFTLQKRYSELNQNITEVFQQTFPGVKRIVEPVHQMKVKIGELKSVSIPIPGMNSSAKLIDLLKDISQRVPASLDVRVTRLVIDPETVRLSGKTDTFNTVDNIKNGLEPSAYFESVSISSANLDRTGKQVQFEIKLQRVK